MIVYRCATPSVCLPQPMTTAYTDDGKCSVELNDLVLVQIDPNQIEAHEKAGYMLKQCIGSVQKIQDVAPEPDKFKFKVEVQWYFSDAKEWSHNAVFQPWINSGVGNKPLTDTLRVTRLIKNSHNMILKPLFRKKVNKYTRRLTQKSANEIITLLGLYKESDDGDNHSVAHDEFVSTEDVSTQSEQEH